MTLDEMIAAFRYQSDDSATNALWTDAELTVWANEAEREAARRSRLIVDIETAVDEDNAPVCIYPVLTNATTITLHRKIIFVRRVVLASTGLPLARVHLRDMDRIAPGWETQTVSEVTAYVPNWRTGKLRFYTGFPAADTVKIQAVRLPLLDMEDGGDEPEIEEMYHLGLVNWMLHRAYNKPDPDAQDTAKAGAYLAMFEQEFGRRSSAVEQVWQQREHGYDEFEGAF